VSSASLLQLAYRLLDLVEAPLVSGCGTLATGRKIGPTSLLGSEGHQAVHSDESADAAPYELEPPDSVFE
jgi:hypothetical protein